MYLFFTVLACSSSRLVHSCPFFYRPLPFSFLDPCFGLGASFLARGAVGMVGPVPDDASFFSLFCVFFAVFLLLFVVGGSYSNGLCDASGSDATVFFIFLLCRS